MRDIDQDLYELRAQLAKGSVQNAYVALVSYMSRLRTRYVDERGEREVSGLYQGCFDMTYFALFSDGLRGHNLKVAVVFDYATFSFQAWLAARNRKVQKTWWDRLRDAGYAKHALVEQGVGIDAIVATVVAADFSLEHEASLTRRIETGVRSFELDMLAVVANLEHA